MALSPHACCSHLASSLPHLISYPNTTAYNAAIQSYWSAEEASLYPTCFVTPECTADVSTIVATLSRGDCEFAIKSAGHAPAAGFANVADGVTVDLTRMHAVKLVGDIAHVQTGANWSDVYAALEPYGKAVAGGRNGQVGVGGLTLGGGISYFGPQVGWTCDTVENFEVVLAGGKVVDANRNENKDLFRALQGGGNNFGVVTRMDFKTVDVGKILAGSISNEFKYREQVFDAFTGIADAAEYDVHASIVMALGFNPDGRNWTVSTTPIYTKPVQRPPVYHDLFAIPNITSSMQLRELSPFSNESAIPQFNFLFYSATYGISTKLLNRVFEVCNSSLYDFKVSDDTLSWSLVFEPLPTVFVSHGEGANSLGTSQQDGNSVIFFFSANWINNDVTAQVQKKAQQVFSLVDNAVKKMGFEHRFVYANYANPSQKVLSSYGAGNLEFLRNTARKYDPKGVFQKLVPGGFKLNS